MRRTAALFILPLLAFSLPSCAGDKSHGMTLGSSAFAPGAAIPKKHTCDGENLSPPLAWSGAPAKVRSFAIVCDDPDARNFTHWVLFNVPGGATYTANQIERLHIPPNT